MSYFLNKLKDGTLRNIFSEQLFYHMMKRIISIPLMILILFSGIRVNIASHYCGGNFASSKVSLNGELASCGMEHQSGTKSPFDQISRHCCEDVIHAVKLNSNYVHSSCLHLSDQGQEIIHLFTTGDRLILNKKIFGSVASGTKRPPGRYNPVSVEQQVICIFQI